MFALGLCSRCSGHVPVISWLKRGAWHCMLSYFGHGLLALGVDRCGSTSVSGTHVFRWCSGHSLLLLLLLLLLIWQCVCDRLFGVFRSSLFRNWKVLHWFCSVVLELFRSSSGSYFVINSSHLFIYVALCVRCSSRVPVMYRSCVLLVLLAYHYLLSCFGHCPPYSCGQILCFDCWVLVFGW